MCIDCNQGLQVASSTCSFSPASASADVNWICRLHLKSADCTWYLQIAPDICRLHLIFADCIWYMQIASDICRLHLTSADFIWHLQIASDICRLHLTYVDCSRCLQLETETCQSKNRCLKMSFFKVLFLSKFLCFQPSVGSYSVCITLLANEMKDLLHTYVCCVYLTHLAWTSLFCLQDN